MRTALLVLLLFVMAGCASARRIDWRTEDFAKVNPGLHMDEVRRILGPFDREEAFARRSENVWDYQFTDIWGYWSYFSVVFDADGRVKHTLTWRKPLDDR